MTGRGKRIICGVIIAIAVLVILVFAASAYVAFSTDEDIVTEYHGGDIGGEYIEEMEDFNPQCILVLGCGVWANNKPSPMLKDRLDAAIELYREGVAPKLLFSGDNSVEEYNEPDCMYRYALEQGIPEEDIFLDYAGFSTYDSVYRAKAIFCVDRAVIVTQKYHLFRALKNADALGLDARGFAANQRKYRGRFMREAREVPARIKDLVKSKFKPEPAFLGDKIPIDGDGRVTQPE